jgi:Tfp pilus assembly protein PilE
VALALLSTAGMKSSVGRGLTFVEGLIVSALIGFVAAIAVPHYLGMRCQGFDSKVVSAVRHAATAQEAYFASNGIYASDPTELGRIATANDVILNVAAGNSGDLRTSFRVDGSHQRAGHRYAWISDPAPGEPHLIAQ